MLVFPGDLTSYGYGLNLKLRFHYLLPVWYVRIKVSVYSKFNSLYYFDESSLRFLG